MELPAETATMEVAYDVRTSGQTTQTRTVQMTQQVDEDGMLTLRIPAGAALRGAVLRVTVQIAVPVGVTTDEEPAHPTYGSIPDFPLDADESYAREQRQWLHERGLLDDPRLPDERREEA